MVRDVARVTTVKQWESHALHSQRRARHTGSRVTTRETANAYAAVGGLGVKSEESAHAGAPSSPKSGNRHASSPGIRDCLAGEFLIKVFRTPCGLLEHLVFYPSVAF